MEGLEVLAQGQAQLPTRDGLEVHTSVSQGFSQSQGRERLEVPAQAQSILSSRKVLEVPAQGQQGKPRVHISPSARGAQS